MITKSNKDYIYIGKEAGKEILSRIKNAKKSVKVVSPYLSPDYIKELIKLHKECRQVTLITCDRIGENDYSDFKVSDLINKKKIYNAKAGKLKRQLLKFSLGLFLISLMLAFPALAFPIIFIFVGIFFVLSILMFLYSTVIMSEK